MIAIVVGFLFSQPFEGVAQTPDEVVENQPPASASGGAVGENGEVAPQQPLPEILVLSAESIDNLTDAVTSLVQQIEANNRPTNNNFEKVIGVVAPVLAGFLGAVLTFLATQYTEKRNWARAQNDALRDRQFVAAASAAKKMREALATVSQIFVELPEINPESSGTALEDQATSMEFAGRRDAWLSRIKASIGSIDLVAVELSLLNLPESLTGSVECFLNRMTAVEAEFEKPEPVELPLLVATVQGLIEELGTNAGNFVESAKSIRGGSHE